MDPVSQNKNDLEIIRQVLNGDREAYAGIVRCYQARIIRLCASLLKNESDAQDAAQEVFVKAYQALKNFQKEASFYTWLYRIASNHCLAFLRSRNRKLTQSLDALLEAEGDRVEHFFSSQTDFRKGLESADLLDKLLSVLPPDTRLILTLREAEGLSYEEIGQVLDCSLDAVKGRLRRARIEIEEKLRHFLKPRSV